MANLMVNALKYAPGCKIKIACRYEGIFAKLIFQDSGPGIDSSKQSKIFERFERGGASRNIGGLGLGLFVVRNIVEAHGGKITLESAPGAGCKFVIQLPLDTAAAESGVSTV